MGRRGYPPEFRRKVLDLVEAGRPIAEVAKALGISAQSIYTWRRQDRIDRGLLPGLSSPRRRSWRPPAVGSRSWRPSWRSRAVPPSRSRSKRPLWTVRGHPNDGKRSCRCRFAAGCWRSRSPASTPGGAGRPRSGRSGMPG
jgi:transposase-like protein